MQKAAKEKSFILWIVASVALFCAPSFASSVRDLPAENRVEIFLLGGQSRVGQQAFDTANRVEKYDSPWGVALESSVAPNRTTFPSTADEMGDFLGFPGTKRPDGPTTPGRDKTVWQPNADTKITLERHPYHPDAPDWHRDYHWHLDTPGKKHQRFLPGDDIPGLGGGN